MEERAARMEANIEHMQSDIADMKVDLRRLNDKIDKVDKSLSVKIDEVDKSLSVKVDGIKDSVAGLALSTEKSFADLKIARALDRVWWLIMSAALLGIMARAFKWI